MASYAAHMPPSQQRRRADAQRNISTIVDTAAELFGRGGNPSMSEIAKAAGIGRVTLYAHFSSREELLDAVVARAITDTTAALSADDLDTQAPDKAMETLLRTSWRALNHNRRLRLAAMDELGPERLREHHDQAMERVDALISRGQHDGMFRTDLSRSWLVSVFYAVLHAAADDVDAGKLTADEAPATLATTLLSLLTAH